MENRKQKSNIMKNPQLRQAVFQIISLRKRERKPKPFNKNKSPTNSSTKELKIAEINNDGHSCLQIKHSELKGLICFGSAVATALILCPLSEIIFAPSVTSESNLDIHYLPRGLICDVNSLTAVVLSPEADQSFQL
ncbi:hypothetical protein HUJ05_002966 [Dendroctonus ponderosae]|nr:hypothetical protein HUJ05_002966 [Dendroctonus ponderosae]